MKQRAAAVFAVAGGLALAACASTTFNSTWKAPDAGAVSFKGQKVAAIVVSPQEGTRRGAEVALARELTARGLEGVAGHSILPVEELRDKDKEKAKARLLKAGVVGAVVMRAVGKEQQLSSTPGTYWGSPYYGSFSGYYGWGWGAVYDPGYLRTDTIVSVETLIYDVKQDKLLWAGMSQTTNPDRVDTLIRDLVAAAAKEVKKQGSGRAK